MKKITALLLAVVLVLSLAACSKASAGKDKKSESVQNTETEKTEETETPEAEDTVVDCYSAENEFGKYYWLFGFNGDGKLSSADFVYIMPVNEENDYIASKWSYREWVRYTYKDFCDAGIDDAGFGGASNADELTKTFAFGITGLDDEEKLNRFMDGGAESWLEDAKDYTRDGIAKAAEDSSYELLSDWSELEIPQLFSISENSCWLCLVPSDSLECFESWDENLCGECYAVAEEHDASIDRCQNGADHKGSFRFVKSTPGQYFCDDCYAMMTECDNCMSVDTSYRNEYWGYYCDECYGDGSLYRCEHCARLVEEVCDYYNMEICTLCYKEQTACYECSSEDTSEREGLGYLCDECFGKVSRCYVCGEEVTEYRAEYTGYYCDECYVEDLLVCRECFILTDETFFLEPWRRQVCAECFERFSACEVCGSADADYSEELYGYFCEACFADKTVCYNCEDSSKKSFYRESYRGYYCDECFGDGEQSCCEYCHKLTDEPFVYERFDYTCCEECFKRVSVCYGCIDYSKDTVYREDLHNYYCDECYEIYK